VFLYFTDLHAHNFPTCSVIGEDGVNSRLRDALAVIVQVCDYAVKHKIGTVVFGGDMFHDRREIPVDVLSLVYKTWFEQAERGLDFYFLVGNHDKSASVPKENSLAPLSRVGLVIDKPTVDNWSSVKDVGFIPYMENAQELRYALKQMRKCRFLFMHQGVEGVASRSGYVLTGQPIKKTDLLRLGPYRISGHIHEEQTVTRKTREVLYYPGSCMQHDWGDAGSTKYFHVFDPRIVNRRHPKFHIRVPTRAPKFVNLMMGAEPPQGKNMFVRFHALTPDDMKLARQLSLAIASHAGVRYVAPPVLGSGALVADEQEERGEPLVLQDLVSRYVAKQVEGPKRRARLERLGKELLHEAATA